MRETRVFVGKRGKKDSDKDGGRMAGGLLSVAGVIIFGALIGAGFVAYEAQRLYALKHNHLGAATDSDQWRAIIIAALPDAGWVAMAMVALVAALRGQSSLRARVGVLIFFALSLGAQILYAPATFDGRLVAVIAPITMAWMLETFIVEVRRWAAARRQIEIDETPILTGVLLAVVRCIRGLAGLLLWFVRLAFDRSGTWGGIHSWILETAPLAPGRTLASQQAEKALETAKGATLTAEQVRKQAHEDHRVAEQLLAEVRQEAARKVTDAEQEAARRIEEAQQEAAQQVAEVQEAARQQTRVLQDSNSSSARARTEELHQLQDALDRVTAERDRALAGAQRGQRVEAEAREVRAQLGAARHAFELLRQYAGARAVLRARYEGLRLDGNGRYGDRDAVPELARTWAPEVGVTEQTARRYLVEHLVDPGAGAGQEGE